MGRVSTIVGLDIARQVDSSFQTGNVNWQDDRYAQFGRRRGEVDQAFLKIGRDPGAGVSRIDGAQDGAGVAEDTIIRVGNPLVDAIHAQASTQFVGVRQPLPLSYLDVGGSFGTATEATAASSGLGAGVFTRRIDATAGLTIATLPDATLVRGRIYVLKKIDATVNPARISTVLGQTIDGLLTIDMLVQYQTVTVQSNGVNWDAIWIGGSGFFAQDYQFGRDTPIPGLGTLQLMGPGSTLVGVTVFRSGTITAGSIRVNMIDVARSYDFDIRVNGVSTVAVALPAGTQSGFSSTFAVGVVAGDFITGFMVMTGGVGASMFDEEHGVVEVKS